jgi:hypothetical protein
MTEIIGSDLDGCISEDAFAKKPELMQEYFRHSEHIDYFISTRNNSQRAGTIKWLDDHGYTNYNLVLLGDQLAQLCKLNKKLNRPKDKNATAKAKVAACKQYGITKFYDDRNDVCLALNEAGINAINMKKGIIIDT